MFSNNGVIAWTQFDPTGDGYSLSHALALDHKNNAVLTGQNANYYPQTQYGTYGIGTNGVYIWTGLYPTGEWYVFRPKASLKGSFFQLQPGQFEG